MAVIQIDKGPSLLENLRNTLNREYRRAEAMQQQREIGAALAELGGDKSKAAAYGALPIEYQPGIFKAMTRGANQSKADQTFAEIMAGTYKGPTAPQQQPGMQIQQPDQMQQQLAPQQQVSTQPQVGEPQSAMSSYDKKQQEIQGYLDKERLKQTQLPLVAHSLTPQQLTLANSAIDRNIARYEKQLDQLEKAKNKPDPIFQKKVDKYESELKTRVDNVDKLNGSINEALAFFENNQDIYGPRVSKLPSWMIPGAETREQLNTDVLNSMLPLEGSLGRGTNMMVRIKQGSKPSTAMLPQDYKAALLRLKKANEKVFQESEDFEKMQEQGLKPDFLTRLTKASRERYKKTGLFEDVKDEELLEAPKGSKVGQTVTINGVEYDVVEQEA